ncbi:MAG: Gfo/Idh/MocA family oxidoreductase [Clostridia bacterium]|nr:Gfo/Idh/MocA family oxidoreductase [Clostridia bacterium]
MLNIAVCSRWHPHATGYGRDFAAHPECNVTVIWDEDPVRGEAWAKELGCDFEPDFDKVLARADVDAICSTAPTSMHKELYIKAAKAGKHIFTEKVLAATKAEALAVKEAVEKYGVKFVISYPFRTSASIVYAKKLIDEGTLGTVNYVRVRNCHSGISDNWLPPHFLDPVPTGGGAMMDLGAHPMYILSYLLGKPMNVVSCYNKLYDTPVDDNCVSVIEFENKVIAVSETGFVTSSSPFSLEVYGTEGSFATGGPAGGTWFCSRKAEGVGKGTWMRPNIPKPGIPSAINQFVGACLRDEEIIFGIDDAIKLSELMEGAYKAWKEGRKVDFAELDA